MTSSDKLVATFSTSTNISITVTPSSYSMVILVLLLDASKYFRRWRDQRSHLGGLKLHIGSTIDIGAWHDVYPLVSPELPTSWLSFLLMSSSKVLGFFIVEDFFLPLDPWVPNIRLRSNLGGNFLHPMKAILEADLHLRAQPDPLFVKEFPAFWLHMEAKVCGLCTFSTIWGKVFAGYTLSLEFWFSRRGQGYVTGTMRPRSSSTIAAYRSKG